MDILTSYHHEELLLTIVALTLLLLSQSKSNQPIKEVFQKNSEGQDFQWSVQLFHQLSAKAQATFMYRFVSSLSSAHIKTIQKYISMHTLNK